MASGGPRPDTTLADVLAAVARAGAPGEPLTTTEVAAELDCSRRTAYDKLERLAERGDVATKKAGARSRVWWRPPRERPGEAADRLGDALDGPAEAGRDDRFRAEVADRLTDRQLEVLETAYRSGYFASPRESTGEDLADALGVSQPTVTEHIRAAEAKIVALLFEEDDRSP